jgi:uncharacterized protein
MAVDGFDWDSGNWPKCGKHGVTQLEIETMLTASGTRRFPAPERVPPEQREIAIGVSPLSMRRIAVIFTWRELGGRKLLRPVSARYMHEHEFRTYLRQIENG